MSTRLAAQLFSNEDVAAAVYCGAFIEYLALVLQGCQVDLSENLHLRMNSDQKLLFYESMRDACQGLSNLCRCVTNESNKSHYQNVYGNVQVCKELFRLHALEDVLALIHKPRYDDTFQEHATDQYIVAINFHQTNWRYKPLHRLWTSYHFCA